MYGQDRLDGLQFNHNRIVDKKIKSMSVRELQSFVVHR